MNFADWIALGLIIFLLICAVRYMIRSRKKGCCGCCSESKTGRNKAVLWRIE